MDVTWETYRVGPDEGGEAASYNVRTEDGQDTGAGGECCASIRTV
jgi:hypothetical protein